jgi:exopolysaccharide production protein ExoQ
VPTTRRPPIYKTVLAWILLLPLLFFVAHGTFSLDRPDEGANSAESNPVTDTRSGSNYYQAEQLLMYVIIIGAMAFSFKSTLNLALQHPLIFSLPLFALVSAMWTQSLSKTIPFAVFGLVLTYFGVYLQARFDPDRLIELFLFVGWAAALISIATVAIYPAAGIYKVDGTGAWRGMYFHKNHLGMITTIMLFPAFFAKPKSQLERVGLVVYFLLSLVLVAFSQSRTAWLLFVVCMAAVAFLKLYPRIPRGERLLLVFSSAILALTVATVAVTSYREIAIGLGKDPTLTGRTLIWSAAWKAVGKHPIIGYGYKAFWLGTPQSDALNIQMAVGNVNLTNSENGILEMWLELGVVGVSLLVLTIAQACRNGLRAFSSSSSSPAVGWFLMIVFMHLLSFVDGEKLMFPHTIEWLLLVTAYVGLAREARQVQAPVTTPHRAALRAQEVG